jgi:FkbM family methyltransferase
MDPIHIACQCDARFAPDCAVMLHSLLSANAGERFVVHFVHDETLAARDRDRLAQIVGDFGSVWEPASVDEHVASQFPFMERYGGATAWFRLLLPRLFEQVSRVLYLDADTMVIGGVRELWETELAGSSLAAVTQPLIRADRERVVRDLGLPDARRFFNSGVMVLDLDRLRQTGLMAEVERFARDRLVPMPWADQEPLNAVLWSERVELHPRWNVMNPCFELPARYLPWPPAKTAEAVRDPAIVHFIGPYKPAHYRLRHPFKAIYFEHLRELGWSMPAEQGRTMRHAALRSLPPVWALRYELAETRLRAGLRGPEVRFRRLAARAIGPRSRAYGWLRAAHRMARPGAAPAPLSDLLDAFADSVPGACFVQIGSNDGDHGDPLRPYVDSRRWRGILVEPVPHVFERLRSKRGDNEQLTLVNAAIAPQDGPMPFYYVAESEDPTLPPWYDEIGSFSLDNVLHPYHVEQIPDLADRIVEAEVMCTSFERLWRTHALPRLDLMHIDAEGFDDVILEQLDLAQLRPVLILYESKHLPVSRADAASARLEQHGYDVLELGPDTIAISRTAPLLIQLAAGRQRRRSR